VTTVVLTKEEYRAARAGHRFQRGAASSWCSCGRTYSSRQAGVWEHSDHLAEVVNEARRAKAAAQQEATT
jgi:hypothetical protein